MSEQPAREIVGGEGVVKWFDPKKGFGFVVGPDGQDIFIHYTVIEGEGFRVLNDDQQIIFDASKTDKGWKATRVICPTPEVTIPDRKGYSRSPRR